MKKVWVIGAGQLGAMLNTAGRPLAIDVIPVEPDSAALPHPESDDIITAERELWPTTPASTPLAAHPHFVNGQVFATLADRLSQKQLLDSLSLATAPWLNVCEHTTTETLYHTLGERLLLKRRQGGYDGRGQHWMRQQRQDVLPDDWKDHCIAEQAIPFDEEVSLVGMRDRQGHCQFFPLTLNLHVDGILMASLAPLGRLAHLQAQAESMLSSLLHELDYVGVMAMECFRVGDRLLINELAPRVHNSGHWTQAGAHCSQFEYHLRAICGLPVPAPQVTGITAMVNLIGTERNDAWLSVSGARLYWYNKLVRPGRKVGHINLHEVDVQSLDTALDALLPLLPENYRTVLAWLQQNLPNATG